MNSSSFIAWVIHEVLGVEVSLPATAIGKGYICNAVLAIVPSGTGYQLSFLEMVGGSAITEVNCLCFSH